MNAVRKAALVLLAFAGLCHAHEVPAAHGCERPVRPANEQDDIRWQQFMGRVDRYRSCMNAFIERNHAASDRHREAANAATMEWNAFVRDSLNVPEDFPWPPEGE